MAIDKKLNGSYESQAFDLTGDEEFIFEVVVAPLGDAKLQFDWTGVVGGTPEVEISECNHDSAVDEHWATLFDTATKTVALGAGVHSIREPSTPYRLIKVKTTNTGSVSAGVGLFSINRNQRR